MTITKEAAEKVKDMLAEQEETTGLRLFIKPGGCSGFSYGMALDGRKDTDQVIVKYGIPLYIEEGSQSLLDGAEVDFIDNMSGAGFTIHNPNAVSTCGCGSSFRTKDDAGVPGSCPE